MTEQGEQIHADRIARIEAGIILPSPLRTSTPERRPLAERMAIHGVPGVSIAVIDGGELAWAKGYGLCEAGRGRPVTTRTLLQAASISKPVTAVAVMRLVQDGRLDLDEDVNRYLTSWQVPANGAWQPRLTLRHLLSHAGATTVSSFPGYRPGSPLPTTLQILDGEPPTNTSAVRVNGIPGLRRRYSGGGTTIVQQVLVDLLRMPFSQLMRELVLDPLGMTDSTYEQPLPESRGLSAAHGHRAAGDPLSAGWAVYPEMAAAGLWTTPTDLARLAIALQRARRGDQGTILSRSSVGQMLTPCFGTDCGVGFFLDGEGQTFRFQHSGANEGFRCNLLAYADHGAGAVVMTNGDEGQALMLEIVGAIAHAYTWPLDPGSDLGTYRPPLTPMISAEAPTDVSPYLGSYELRANLRIRISGDNGVLALQLPDQSPVPLTAISPDAFIADALDIQVRFERDESGKVSSLAIVQDGAETRLRRVTD